VTFVVIGHQPRPLADEARDVRPAPPAAAVPHDGTPGHILARSLEV
jgi:hypothetical protein